MRPSHCEPRTNSRPAPSLDHRRHGPMGHLGRSGRRVDGRPFGDDTLGM